MTADEKAVELYRRYRPLAFEDMIGQDEVVEMVETMIEKGKTPHCILASGPSGVGKTTLFRILRASLDCSDLDFKEVNAADTRGIDLVRDIRGSLGLSPINGKCKVWLVDEAHQLTGPAQESFLKILEDTPSHVYFFLASTDPQKLRKTILTRCTHFKLSPLSMQEIHALVTGVYKSEKKEKMPDSLASVIAELSEGSARKGLVLLHQVIDMDISDEDAVVEVLKSTSTEREAIEICRAIMNRSSWSQLAAILKGVADQDPEQIRRRVLGYMRNTALSGAGMPSRRAVEAIVEFEGNFFDSGHAGLVRACYSLTGSKE